MAAAMIEGLFDAIKTDNMGQFTAYYGDMKLHFENKQPSILSLIFHDLLHDCLKYHRLDIGKIILSDLSDMVTHGIESEPEILSNIDFFRLWYDLVQNESFEFKPMFLQFSNIVPNITDLVDPHVSYRRNYMFYEVIIWIDLYLYCKQHGPDYVNQYKATLIPALANPLHIGWVKTKNALEFLEQSFALDYHRFYEALTIDQLDVQFYQYLKQKINDAQFQRQHPDILFKLNDLNYRNQELIQMGTSITEVIEQLNHADFTLTPPLSPDENINQENDKKISLDLRILRNAAINNDCELFQQLHLPIEACYWLLFSLVKKDIVIMTQCIFKRLRKSLVDQYGLFLPDHFKSNLNLIAEKITNLDIFQFVHDHYKDLLLIDTYNNIMYEAAYHNDLELFKAASQFGNEWGNSYYEATRCDCKQIIKYIEEQPIHGLDQCNFQQCFKKTINDLNRN